MWDKGGLPIGEQDLCQLLCTVEEIHEDGIVVRILNSDMELKVSAHCDEVLGAVASPELVKYVPPPDEKKKP